MESVTTRKVKLVADRWDDLGAGPVHLGSFGGELYYSIGDSAPAANDVGFMLRFEDSPVNVLTRSRICARACVTGYAAAIVAPLTNVMGKP